MGSCERVVMGLESRAVSARVTEHFVTIFSTTCNNNTLTEIFLSTMLVRLQLSGLVASCHLLIFLKQFVPRSDPTICQVYLLLRYSKKDFFPKVFFKKSEFCIELKLLNNFKADHPRIIPMKFGEIPLNDSKHTVDR